jgi:hypothetical protein
MSQSDLVNQLCDLLIVPDRTGPVFQKRGYQRSPYFIQRAARKVITQLPDKPDAVCALGTSGLALGIFLGHELSIPIYFFKSNGWPRLKDGRTLHVLPEPSKPARVLLADSHYRSSYTWAKAENFLRKNTPLEPVAIALIFHPDMIMPLEGCSVPIYSVVKATENLELLYHQLGCASESELKQALEAKSKFWGTIKGPTDVGAARRFLRHTDALLLPSKTSSPQFEVVHTHPNLRTRIEDIPMNDPGIWQYYLYPDLTRDIAITIGETLDFSKFSELVGVSVLGTSIALSLAYHNIANLRDTKIFSSYFEQRLVPRPLQSELENREILLCQMRLTSGLLTNDAMKLIERENGSCSELVAIRTNLSLEPRRRKRPLYVAGGRGLEKVYSLVNDS